MPISGMVLDRLGTRAALTAGPIMAATAAALAGLTPWFSVILVMIFLVGIGESVWVIAREVAGIDLARQDQRGRVLSGFHGINNVGLALGPLIGGLLTESIGFRAVFIGYALCAAASALLGTAVAQAHAPQAVKVAPRLALNLAALNRWARGLIDLFHQIQPDLRATYVDHTRHLNELHASGTLQSMRLCSRLRTSAVAQGSRYAVYNSACRCSR
jgi:MFS family permease